jgi:predicted AAA+ superfamily ATPase
MIKRRLESQIIEALERSPSVALLGPRQVGKTTIALNISETTPSVYRTWKTAEIYKRYRILKPSM